MSKYYSKIKTFKKFLKNLKKIKDGAKVKKK